MNEFPALGEWVFETNEGASIHAPLPHALGDFVRDALEALDPEDRDFLLRYFYERLTYDSIADEMRAETGETHYDRRHAHQRVGRALRRLRRQMDSMVHELDSDQRKVYENFN